MRLTDAWRTAFAASGLLALAACGGATDAALETSAEAPAATTDNACKPLALTGLCSNGDPSIFLKTNAQAPKLAAKCEWRTQEIGLTPTDAIVFRAQDCTAEGWVPNTYEVVQSYVKYRMEGTPEDQAMFILEMIPLADGETAEQAAMKTLGKAPEDQRTRCETRLRTGPVVAGTVFELAPNAELEAEMNAAHPDEPWDACGPNGFTGDAEQYWEARPSYALFHMLGQDDPPWDPASFTFYRKGADGKWAKAG
jgi:hypothetical protein